jgi:hypothetical protein
MWEPEPPGTLWATPGLLRDSFTFILTDVKLLLLALQQVIMIIMI